MDMEALRAALVALGGVAGALTAIWGAMKLMVIVPEAIRKRIAAHREKKNAPMKALMEQMNRQSDTLLRITRRLDELESSINRTDKATERIEKDLKVLDDSIATLQRERLNQAFVHYVDEGNPCPMDVKMSLTAMCQQYRARGHNHLHESYIERLEECPTK